jgi:hypothetical protein
VVASRHDMKANHLFMWIRQAQEGMLQGRRSRLSTGAQIAPRSHAKLACRFTLSERRSHGHARPHHPPLLRHHRDWQRELAGQEQSVIQPTPRVHSSSTRCANGFALRRRATANAGVRGATFKAKRGQVWVRVDSAGLTSASQRELASTNDFGSSAISVESWTQFGIARSAKFGLHPLARAGGQMSLLPHANPVRLRYIHRKGGVCCAGATGIELATRDKNRWVNQLAQTFRVFR